jgi:hypothetical protein
VNLPIGVIDVVFRPRVAVTVTRAMELPPAPRSVRLFLLRTVPAAKSAAQQALVANLRLAALRMRAASDTQEIPVCT